MENRSVTKNQKSFLFWVLGIASFLVLVVAGFVAEENFRGRSVWEKTKAGLMAKGEVLDWKGYIPAPVPDDQNIFKAPMMTEWFIRSTNNLMTGYNRWKNTNTDLVITSELEASNYIAWSDGLNPDFQTIRNALKRPLARMEGDYDRPFERPIANFVSMRIMVQLLAQRARCHLLLHQPEEALADVTLINDMRRLLDAGGPNKASTLVEAMISVAIAGLYLDVVANGMDNHQWRESQLIELQKQLTKINLPAIVVSSIRVERAAVCETLENQFSFDATLKKELPKATQLLMLRGWIYLNMATIAIIDQKMIDTFDLTNSLVLPASLADYNREVSAIPHNFCYALAAITLPVFDKAAMTTAFTQSKANEALIACALERYNLEHGEYPETLDELVPQFMDRIPHDIIGGNPLIYHRTSIGRYFLYSVGWNGTDDGGPGELEKDVAEDLGKGDWFWPAPSYR